MSVEADYLKKLADRVIRAVEVGAGDLREVSVLCNGADPSKVSKILAEQGLTDTKLAEQKREAVLKAARARRTASDLLAALPGANPDDSQWWFTLDCVERVCTRIYLETGAKKLINIGASTLAPYYRARFSADCIVLDVDEDVVEGINTSTSLPMGTVYNVFDSPSKDIAGADVVIIDPPWYEAASKLFLKRAAQLVSSSGAVYCTIPGELTRPNKKSERQTVLDLGSEAGLEFEDLHTQIVEYVMPDFEREAFRAFEKIHALPWRYADLLRFRVQDPNKAQEEWATEAADTRPERYSRGSGKKLRLFLRKERVDADLPEYIEPVPEFSSTVSSREVDRTKIALWTSTNVGFKVRDYNVAKTALTAWQEHKSKEEALATVRSNDAATLFLKKLFDTFPLPDDAEWAKRSPQRIAEFRKASLSMWAASESTTAADDGYRNRFARDRDRVLWSNGIRQLANKTQVFSTGEADHVRQRLTHSTEVMQLATTVGTSLGLDRDLIEAGALAHDIGHTPFGHAGEVALDKSLRSISKALSFNHYEHGLDVVVWLEDAYRHPSNGEKFGLDLSPEVLECIIKHTFCYGEGSVSQAALYKASKHKVRLTNKPCHLEGQAVRAADKISYLISDIEDGLRLGAITIQDLKNCALFRHPPIDLAHGLGENPLSVFVSQRRSVINVLMQDLIDETARRLARFSARASIFDTDGYTVDHSSTIRTELNEVWSKVQAGRIHRDQRVVSENRRAAYVINRLVMVYALRPDLIESTFRTNHMGLSTTPYIQWYRDRIREEGVRIPAETKKELALEFMIGYNEDHVVKVEDVVMAKDFVASMTDQSANARFKSLFAS